jgi:hypothetical protein
MVLVVHFQLLKNLVANHPYQPQTQQRIWAATDCSGGAILKIVGVYLRLDQASSVSQQAIGCFRNPLLCSVTAYASRT